MGFLRGAGRWILSLLIGTLVAAWVGVMVMQAALLNQQVVGGWLSSSGTYQHFVGAAFMLNTGQGAVTKTNLQNALAATFPPSYVEQQANVVLNATYNWLNGKAPAITFSIPLQDKRNEYSANLQKELEKQFANLPTCPTRLSPDISTPTCIPQGVKVSDLAGQLSQISGDSSFLNQPITPASLAQGGAQVPNAPYLPTVVNYMHQATYALPIIMVLLAAGYVWLSTEKLRGLGVVGRRVFIQGILLMALGLLLWYFGLRFNVATAQNSNDSSQAIVKTILVPLLQLVLAELGRLLAFYSGFVALAGASTWLTSLLLRRRQMPAVVPPPTPKPPAQNLPTGGNNAAR